nr:hypothetical protein [Tanacetum cinerariifolium]
MTQSQWKPTAVNHTCMENDKRIPVDSKENTNCVRENGECLELEAEIAKTKKLLSESAQRCSQLEQHYAQLKNVPIIHVGPTLGDCVRQALETEITQLKDRITSLNIQLNAYKIENKSLSQKYEELAKSNMFSRAELTGRITALTSENANLKAGIKGKQISEPKKSKKPKVLAPGMFSIPTKYIPPPRRENWVAPTPKPRKKQVNIREPIRTTQKQVV